jgi:hypothetical protein
MTTRHVFLFEFGELGCMAGGTGGFRGMQPNHIVIFSWRVVRVVFL